MYWLRMGNEYLEQAEYNRTKKEAIESFRKTAKELYKYEQPIEASIHIASSKEELNEYPDFVLSVGPRGGIKCERA